MQLQKQLISTKPQTNYRSPTAPFREYCYRFVISQPFTLFIASIVIANIIVLCMEYYGSSPQYQLGLDICNAIFMGIFCIELVLKMIALGPSAYFRDPWCVLDFIIVAGSLADVFLTFLTSGIVSASIIRILRVFRLLKLVKWSKRLRVLMVSLSLAVPSVFNVFCIFFIVLYIYAVIGVSVFGTA